MSNIIQIILIIIFAYIAGRKYIIPRIKAKRMAKNGVMTPYPVPDDPQEALAKGGRKVTRFDMQFVDLAATDGQLEAELGLRAKVDEMLILASARGTDVRLGIVQMGVNLLVYVTYAV